MLCEKCKKKKATLYYHENINGKRRSFHLCTDCANTLDTAGELEDFSIAFPLFTSPFSPGDNTIFSKIAAASAQSPAGDASDRACPVCGLTFGDITSSGKVGCSKCYEVFAPRLLPLIRAVHGHNTHVGHTPRVHRERAEKQARIAKLKEQLRNAVNNEAFEDAVVLRDELRRMESES